MPLNDKKIIEIILLECNEIEERCDGYQDEIIEVISEILIYERKHRVSATRTSIQKKINDKCNATAQFLAKQRKQKLGSKVEDS